MRSNIVRRLIGIALLLAFPAKALADEPDPSLIPPVSWYELTKAYQNGGAAERDGLLAEMSRIPGADPEAVTLGPGRDTNGDFNEVHIKLEVVEIQEEVAPGKFVTFWVYAPLGAASVNAARLPSPTIRVQQGDRVFITLYNTHYLPHTIHLHGLSQTAAMDGNGMNTSEQVQPGHKFTYEFTAGQPGTYYYHCHVQEQVHIPMGLAGMLIIEPRRPHNHFARLVMGAGRVYSRSVTAREQNVAAEYSMVYMDVDERLNQIPAFLSDPREIEWRMDRDYDVNQRQPNLFLLNGRAFPYTMRDTSIQLVAGQTTKLRVLNVGEHTLALHPHGHHPVLTALDGYPVPDAMRLTRDVFAIAPAQRVDLDIKAGADGFYASGPGDWMLHDHGGSAATTDGISPGGNQTMMAYVDTTEPPPPPAADEPGALQPRVAMPKMHHAAEPFMRPGYYQGLVSPFDERSGIDSPAAKSKLPFEYPTRRLLPTPPRLDLIDAERHRVIASSCNDRPRATREVLIQAGRKFAAPGQAYAFSPNRIVLGRCEAVTITLENTDEVRHELMIPGLDPMLTLNFVGPGRRSVTFVTPDRDVTLPFHCHVPAHDKVGMLGEFVIGRGGKVSPVSAAQPATPVPNGQPDAKGQVFTGEGEVTAVIARTGKLVVDHGPIKGFMAAMEMSYRVDPPELLDTIKAGDKIRFTIDATAGAIIAIEVIGRTG